MAAAKQSSNPLLPYTAFGTLFQIAMVVAGHYNEFIKNNVFAIGGMAISLIFGAAWARAAATSKGSTFGGGALVGGLCALIGIAASVAMGDTEAAVLAFGTIGSAVTGGLGGLAAFAVSGRRLPSAA